MTLAQGQKNGAYQVKSMHLPMMTTVRLQALGLTGGTIIHVLNRKNGSTILKVRGTRLAVGKQIAENICVDMLEDGES